MLFTSWQFLLVFLPATLLGFAVLQRYGSNELCVVWLLAASCVFYGYWSIPYFWLLAGAMTVNFILGRLIDEARGKTRRILFGLAVAANLALLCYYKYVDFFISAFADLTGVRVPLLQVFLPLGISFFTFQKIAYISDIHVGKAKSRRFLDFALFVFFFPQLIAGPIVHHAEVMPQFRRLAAPAHVEADTRWTNYAVGFALLAIGLVKKVVVADNIAPFVEPAFATARVGDVGAALAWQGALCYGVQLYFDFSGYSDMAIGLARLFGVRLPANFDKPYASVTIVEFWRRWHMTLSRFLRDYVYIPLGGNRNGETRRAINLLATMVLGGFWHGANYTFIIWGGLHGFYLLVAHAWTRHGPWRLPAFVSRILTLVFVLVAWAPFRADSAGEAGVMMAGMIGLKGLRLDQIGFSPGGFAAGVALLIACVVLPSARQILRAYHPTLGAPAPAPEYAPALFARPAFTWPSLAWAAFLAAGIVAVELFSWQTSEFLFFRF
ncbi:MAG: MBOAT family O-acyltransferase [Rhodoblastus sp.]